MNLWSYMEILKNEDCCEKKQKNDLGKRSLHYRLLSR